jgi:hypothetical protein
LAQLVRCLVVAFLDQHHLPFVFTAILAHKEPTQ